MLIIIYYFRVNSKIIKLAFDQYYKSSSDYTVVFQLTKNQASKFKYDPNESFGEQLNDFLKDKLQKYLIKEYDKKNGQEPYDQMFKICFLRFNSPFSSNFTKTQAN